MRTNRKNSRRRSHVARKISALLAVAFAVPASADVTWIGTTGDWSNASNWSNGVVPVTADYVNLTQTDSLNRFVNLDVSTATLGEMFIDSTGSGLMTFTQSANTLTIAQPSPGTGGGFGVGFNGRGAVFQTGGTTHVMSLGIGEDISANGRYTLSGSAVLQVNSETIAQAGSGTFSQSDATHTIGALYMAYDTGSTATYNLSGNGSLTASTEEVGVFGAATFNQSGGSNTVSSYILVGESASATGIYNLSGGTLSAGMNLGNENYSTGVGTLNITGGSYSGGVTIENTASAVNLTAGTFTGGLTLRAGTFRQTGGTFSPSNIVLTSGLLATSGSPEIIGSSAGQTFQQFGGTHTADSLILASAAGTTATYTSQNPGLNAITGLEVVGYSGSATFSSGTLNTAGSICIAYNPSSSGLYYVGETQAQSMYVGGSNSAPGGAGVLNLSSFSTATVSTLKVWDTPGTGISFAGGTLSADSLDMSGNSSRFSWTAGTLAITGAVGFTPSTNNIGPTPTLASTESLLVTNTLSLPAGTSLTLNGSTVSAGTLDTGGAPSRFTWTSGLLAITGSPGLTPSSSNVGAAISLPSGKRLTVTNTLSLPSGTSVSLTGGTLAAGAIDTTGNPSGLSWTSGLISFSGAASFTPQSNNLGVSISLPTGKLLGIAGPLTLSSPSSISLTGGTLTASTLDTTGNPSGLSWTSGQLSLTSANGVTAATNTLGLAISLASGKKLSVTGALTIPSGSSLSVTGGSATAASLTIDGGAGTLSAGTLSATSETIGLNGIGSFNQITGGTNLTGANFRVGVFAGSIGTFTLAAGTLSTGGENIGPSGTGTFIQNGGTNTIGSLPLMLGATHSGNGTFNLAAGTTTLSSAYVGGTSTTAGGTGLLKITGGTFNDSGIAKLYNTPGSGIILSGGTLAANGLDISANPSAFTWTAGTLALSFGINIDAISSNLVLNTGQILNCTASFTPINIPHNESLTINGGTATLYGLSMSGGSMTISSGALSASGGLNLGEDSNPVTITQSGGNVSSQNGMLIGDRGSGAVTYNLSGGTLSVFTTEYLGRGSVMNQSGGLNTVTAGISTLNIGDFSAVSYNLAGTGTINATTINIGSAGSGTLTQTGGVIVTSGTSNTINVGPSGSGVYNLSAGTANTSNMTVGNGTSGVVNVSGGALTVNGTLRISSNGNAGFSLSGGTVSAGTLDAQTIPSHLTWTAGTLAITGNSGLSLTTSTLGTGFVLNPNRTLRVTKSITVPAGATFGENGGTLTATSMTIDGTYNQTSGAVTIPAFTVDSTGSFNASTIIASTLNITGKATLFASSGTSRLSSLAITSPGKFELNNNPLVIDYTTTSPAVTLRGYLATGYNAGKWDGVGIDSSAAHTDATKHTALGYAEATDVGITSFDGKPVTTALLIKYTYYGDSSLDGKVDLGNDFTLFLEGYLTPGASTWELGDYNYDGQVTTADFDLFIDTYKSQGSPLGQLDQFIESSPLLTTTQKSQLLSAVPEPAVPLFTLGLLAISRFRRLRRQNPRR